MSTRMTITTLTVIQVFLTNPSQELYGMEIQKLIGLSSGTLYPILARLSREG
jgi:PadR family transcriptional regulator PadR